jgi:hypothetical protein
MLALRECFIRYCAGLWGPLRSDGSNSGWGTCPSGMEPCAWEVVVLAAASAMETGRRYTAPAVRCGEVPGGDLADRASRRAVTDFWGRLQGFAAFKVPRHRSAEAWSFPRQGYVCVFRVVGS